LKGGKSGGAIVPGDGEKSLLAMVLQGQEDGLQMPPTGETLSFEEIVLLKKWIDEGARAPSGSEAEADLAEAKKVVHWAFVPPSLASEPSRDGTANPIDAFLSVQRDRQGLIPNLPAPRAAQFRRLCIDLIGLPPTREELTAFLADNSEDAYERAVDRLLASPQYGERWGRHWMDIWRYADADGRKAKSDIWWSSPHLWRWRDWIVNSLNEDKGYDRMVLEMLAGDEVAPNDPEVLAATGFIVRNWFKLDRNIWLNDVVEHTAKAFLGLTMGCARCHDHKFDPISQMEYFQFRAFFEPVDTRADPVAGEAGARAFVARAFDAHPEEPTWIFVRGDPKAPNKTIPISAKVPAALGAIRTDETPSPPAGSTGRRLALAHWIGNPSNPLAARVAVNHMWTRHFGSPLVPNVAEFGLRTPPPVQQPLLDWLAVEFIRSGWSMKHIHRLIVTSASYRMHSGMGQAAEKNVAVDRENRFYWRGNSQRMEAEVVRDSLLWLAGALELTPGGPPVDPIRGSDTGRRSLYYRYSREDRMEFLAAFDSPRVEECYRREESIVPVQALALQNSDFSWDQARRIARRLEAGSADSAAFVRAAFEHLLSRLPEPAELAACERFLARQQSLATNPGRSLPLPAAPAPRPIPAAPKDRVPGLPLVLGGADDLPQVEPSRDPVEWARESLIHALINHNDFVQIR
jgi:hypothetical protein